MAKHGRVFTLFSVKQVAKIDVGGTKITLGADIEGNLLKGDTIVSADDVYPDDEKGKAVKTAGYIGCDGRASTFEIRPAPSADPETLVRNIHSLLSFVTYRDGFKIDIAGNNYPLGTHVHFGGKGLARKFKNGEMEGLVALLDDFLGKRLLPLSGAARGDYAQLGQVREQPHGFEYRTLPACVIGTPAICGVVFRLARALVDEAVAGDVTYRTDSTGAAERAEYEKRLGPEQAAVLFDFIEKYGKHPRKRGHGVHAEWPNVTPDPIPLKDGALEFDGKICPVAERVFRTLYDAFELHTAVRVEVLGEVNKDIKLYQVATNRDELAASSETLLVQDTVVCDNDDGTVILRMTPSLVTDMVRKKPGRARALVVAARELCFRINAAARTGAQSPEREELVPTAPKPSQYDNVSEYTAAMALAVKPGTEVEVIAPYAYSNYALTPGLTGRIACVDTYGAFVEFGATANENGAPVGSMQGPTAERMWRNCVWLRYGNLAITGRQREAPAPADMDEMLRNGNFLSAKEFRNPYVNYENQDQGLPNMHLAKYDDYLAKVLPPGHVLPVKDANTGVEGVLGRAMTAKVPIGHGTVACVRWNDGKTTHVLSSDSLTPVGPARKEDFTPPSDAHIVCDAAMLPRGTTIRRGPDWKWKDQGSQLGSVVGRRHDTAPGWVIVRWDNGETNHYRMGAYQQDGKTHPPKYDLEVALTQGKEEKKRGFVGRLLDRFRR